MRKKGLLDIPSCVPAGKSDPKLRKYAQTVELNGRWILNVDIEIRGTVIARYYADLTAGQYGAYVTDPYHELLWHDCKLDGAESLCSEHLSPPYMYPFSERDNGWDGASREIARQAVMDASHGEQHSVWDWEYTVASAARYSAEERKRERISRMMAEVPPAPRQQILDYAMELTAPWQPIGYYMPDEDPEKGHKVRCMVCRSAFDLKDAGISGKPRHGRMITCPHCGKRIELKSSKKLRSIEDEFYLYVYQPICDNQFVERTFKVTLNRAMLTQNMNLEEQIRVVFSHRFPEGRRFNSVSTGRFVCEGRNTLWFKTNPLVRTFHDGYVLPTADLQHVWSRALDPDLRVDGLIGKKVDWSKIHQAAAWATRGKADFDREAQYKALIGFMAGGYRHLAKDLTKNLIMILSGQKIIVNPNGRKPSQIIGLDGNRTAQLRRLDGGEDMLQLLRRAADRNERVSDEDVSLLSRSEFTCRDALLISELTDLSLARIANYVRKNREAMNGSSANVLSTWRDYLEMAREDHMDLHDDIVRRPKDLRLRHDQMVEHRKDRENEELRIKYLRMDMGIQTHLDEGIEELTWSDEDIVIRPATSCMELVAESRALHHCVGTSTIYMKKMEGAVTWIFFMRRKCRPDEPWWTIELRLNGDWSEIMQAYTAYDRKNGIEEIQPAMNAWLKKSRQLLEEMKNKRVQVRIGA